MTRNILRALSPASLSARLALVLAFVQLVVVLAGMAAWMLTSPYVNWNDVAAETAGALVADSVANTPGGGALTRTPSLAAYAARHPTLRYAAAKDGHILPGSSPDLATALAALGPTLPRDGRLAATTPDGADVRFAPMPSPAGDIVVATSGNVFHLSDDLATYFTVYAVELVPMFGPAILAAALIMPLAVRVVLRPLRRAAAAAERIDLASLDRRLPETVPPELQPFVAAINRLLARLEDGVQRQRLFTANAAHELRTPVAILQARIDALPHHSAARADLAGDVRRITLMLDQLLAVARFGQSEAGLNDLLPLHRIAHAVVADLAPLAIGTSRHLALEERGPAGAIRGNSRALESAIGNLVVNALRAEPSGGTVIVETGPGPRIAVIDHGPGIAEEDLPLVFEPFWRKEETTPGTGLGLTIVRQVAQLHGGEARVASRPGQGAVFELVFPDAPAGPAEPAAPARRPPPISAARPESSPSPASPRHSPAAPGTQPAPAPPPRASHPSSRLPKTT